MTASLIKAHTPENFQILSGDDPLTIEFMKRGACGLVSVAANIIPEVMSNLVHAMNEDRIHDAKAILSKYDPLLKLLMSIDTNPVPIKSAIALQGYCTDEFRLPLVGLAPDKLEILKTALTKSEII